MSLASYLFSSLLCAPAEEGGFPFCAGAVLNCFLSQVGRPVFSGRRPLSKSHEFQYVGEHPVKDAGLFGRGGFSEAVVCFFGREGVVVSTASPVCVVVSFSFHGLFF